MFKKISVFGLMVLMFFSCTSAPKTGEAAAFREEAVSIDAGDHVIPAIVTMPAADSSAKFPVVIMLHGYGSNKDEAGNGYKLFAPELAKKGIASIRIDFMGYGDSTVDHVNYDLNVGVSEAIAAADYAAGLSQIDPERIGIMGWSKGGAIAMLAAGRSAAFKSVVTWAGAPKLTGVYTPEAYETAKRDGVFVETFEWRDPLTLSLNAFEIAASTHVLEVFSASAAPILAITGSEDTVVPPINALHIKEVSANKQSLTLEIPGADHTFNIFTGDMTAFNTLMHETVTWFLGTL